MSEKRLHNQEDKEAIESTDDEGIVTLLMGHIDNPCEVDVEGKLHQFALTSGFWRNCPEFRDSCQPIIKEWLTKHKTLNWPIGKPPQMQLMPLGSDKFRLLP